MHSKRFVLRQTAIGKAFNLAPFMAFCVAFSPLQAWAVQFPEFPAANHMKLTIVSEELELNGISMQLLEFRSDEGFDQLQSFYKSKWSGAVALAETEHFIVISHREGDFLQAVQIDRRSKVGSKGILSTSLAFDEGSLAREELGEGFPMFSRSKVINDIKAIDGSKHSRTLVIESPDSVYRNHDFYHRRFGQEGWMNVASPKALDKSALILSRRNEELNMTFVPTSSGTVVVAVLVTHR